MSCCHSCSCLFDLLHCTFFHLLPRILASLHFFLHFFTFFLNVQAEFSVLEHFWARLAGVHQYIFVSIQWKKTFWPRAERLHPWPQNDKKTMQPKIPYVLGCPPAQDASHHQDCYVFSRGSRPKPSFATVTGRGDNPTYVFVPHVFTIFFTRLSHLLFFA